MLSREFAKKALIVWFLVMSGAFLVIFTTSSIVAKINQNYYVEVKEASCIRFGELAGVEVTFEKPDICVYEEDGERYIRLK